MPIDHGQIAPPNINDYFLAWQVQQHGGSLGRQWVLDNDVRLVGDSVPLSVNPAFETPPARYDELYAHALPFAYQPVTGLPFLQGHGDSFDIHPNDVRQGIAPDCAFLSAMTTIAHQNPDLIRNMIADNGDGTYTIRFYTFEDSIARPVYVRVDNQFPLKSDGRPAPVFARYGDVNANGEYELWPLLLEKGFAIYNGGSYWSTGTSGARAMEVISGCPSQSILTRDMTLADFVVLAAQLDRGYGMTADSLQADQAQDHPLYISQTLIDRHVYSIVDIEIRHVGSNGVDGTTILRDPHGLTVQINIEDALTGLNKISVNPLAWP